MKEITSARRRRSSMSAHAIASRYPTSGSRGRRRWGHHARRAGAGACHFTSDARSGERDKDQGADVIPSPVYTFKLTAISGKGTPGKLSGKFSRSSLPRSSKRKKGSSGTTARNTG